ncbi:SDR family NAD(P)-dependent oxidoreductase [Aestuariivirga sp.]|uniref:SDR family NAD(P)-dependent oxidoreductase n=1 Tax=Aestuariivirga sp. TaxID=2650926 RepID=UPI0035939793
MTEGLDFDGRRILITGGGTGIGATTAKLLAARGARVAILDRDRKSAEATVSQLGDNQGLGWGGDVTDPAAVDAILDAMTAHWGGIDGLVNNAGTWDHGALLEISIERWRKVFEVNLMAPIAISNAAVPRMQSGGSVVNVSSVLGQVAAPGRGPYCVSKSALIALTKMQAIEWAERGIRVNAIAPGYIMNETTRALADTGSFDPSAINRRTPMGRFGEESEVAEGIAYLLDPVRASYMTGHVLEVNGGWTAYGFT